MYDKVKNRHDSLVQPVHPQLILARGGAEFAVGIDYIHRVFAGKTFIDVYNHPYFIEGTASHFQPSPRLQLTEELQNINNIMKGIRYMKDRLSLLDMTMVLATEVNVPSTFFTSATAASKQGESGELNVLYNPCSVDEKTRADFFDKRLSGRKVHFIVLPTASAWRSCAEYAALFPDATILSSCPIPEEGMSDPRMPSDVQNRIRVLGSTENNVFITPNIELIRIRGDDLANEFVMLHHTTKILSCSELFHGAYSDFDPLNSWLCRVWFKMQKEGNYRRTDIVPYHKMKQVKECGSLELVRQTIDELSERQVGILISAHGSQPIGGDPINLIREQWGMSMVKTTPVDYEAMYKLLGPESIALLRPARQEKSMSSYMAPR